MRNEELMKKWAPILEHNALPAISDNHKEAVTATLLENTEQSIKEGSSLGNSGVLTEAPTNSTGLSAGAGGNYDPVLISLVRRAMPNLVAYDIVGVQPMTGPTGLIFAMRSHYGNPTSAAEALYGEADTAFSGDDSSAQGAGGTGTATAAAQPGMATGTAEALGDTLNTSGATGSISNPIADMAFKIDKVSVTAVSRALKAEYTSELAQDLKAIHGLDAETELANMLSAELLAEINREVVRTVYTAAKVGAQDDVANSGTFNLDVDANGRWSVEKFKGLMFQIEREANEIAKETRRGKGNIVIASSDVASALQMAGMLDYTPALNSNLTVDDTGNTFAGVLNGRYKVYVDPYAGSNYLVVGYKGTNAFDAGIFYCPYVPLQMVRAVGENSFQSKIGFKTRYGLVANPMAGGFSSGVSSEDGLSANQNKYYRKVIVSNLL
ncbi:ATP-binding protein [bacterium]|nr:ATP-binding protein [bacterium]